MWTPPQWRIAFPAVSAVMLALAALLAWSLAVGSPLGSGLAGGVIVGLIAAKGRPHFTLSMTALCVPLITSPSRRVNGTNGMIIPP